jgi:predicted RNA-binding protein with PIN domain
VHWVVDGMNLIGSRPDGWWRDRPAARVRLVEELAGLAARTGDRVTVVFDGRPGAGEDPAPSDRGVTVSFAPGGPDAADDVIAALVGRPDHLPGLRVVTSDAGLSRRVRSVGVPVTGVSAFRDLLDRSALDGS